MPADSSPSTPLSDTSAPRDETSSSTPRGSGATDTLRDPEAREPQARAGLLSGLFRGFRRMRGNGQATVREALEELIEEHEEGERPIEDGERALLSNILDLRGRAVSDVMVPRADVITVEHTAGRAEVIDLIRKHGHSRIPVYCESLDDAIGMVHAKDVLTWPGDDADFNTEQIMRKLLFVAPSMEVLDLLLEMRVTRLHMALVVDEYGGVDGLVTIEDLVEEIVGEIQDEHDRDEQPFLTEHTDGSFMADARVPIEDLEEKVGAFVDEEEREDIDTLGGLVFTLAGRVPVRGELIRHGSGVEFEILDVDPRRIKRLRVRRPEVLADASSSGAA